MTSHPCDTDATALRNGHEIPQTNYYSGNNANSISTRLSQSQFLGPQTNMHGIGNGSTDGKLITSITQFEKLDSEPYKLCLSRRSSNSLPLET